MSISLANRTGQTIGPWTVVGLADPGSDGRARWHVKCKHGRRKTIRDAHLPKAKFCDCDRRRSRFVDRSGEEVHKGRLLLLSPIWKQNRWMYKAKCLVPVNGQPCGRMITVKYPGHQKSCGHHRPGYFRKGLVKMPSRTEDGGRWWILPSRAAKVMKLARMRADRNAWGEIERRLLPRGLNGAAVEYLAEEDVFRCANAKKATGRIPNDEANLSLGQVAAKLGRSKIRVREVLRETFGVKKLPKVRGKDRRDRATQQTCVPRSLLAKLEAYFASYRHGLPSLSAAEIAAELDQPTRKRAGVSGAAGPELKGRRGPKPKLETARIEEFCYDCREAAGGRDWSKPTARKVKDNFNRPHFDDVQARAYASRWAAKLLGRHTKS